MNGAGPGGAGGQRARKRRWYPTEDEHSAPKTKRHYKQKPLRPSITPGTVLILLAGKHKGRRVLFLKQLEDSGMLLVTGPYKVNGVPARRVHQRFVIATSTKVDLPKLDLDVFTDKYFRTIKPDEKKKKKRSQDDYFEAADEDEKKEFKSEYYENNKKLDTAIEPILKEDMKGYLKSFFTLRTGDRPHLMKF